MLDLDQETLTELKKILTAHVPKIKVLAYGSRVKGTSHAGSDLDLALIHPEGKPIDTHILYTLRNALEESNIPILVDVLDWARIPEPFKKEISAANVKLN